MLKMRLNKITIILSILLLYLSFSLNAEPMKFTQYYAIETNDNDNIELTRVIERVHEYLKNNEIEHTGFFNKTTTLTKFVRVDAKIKNGENILIDTIKRDSKGIYTAKVCVYNIKDGKRTGQEKALSHLHKKYDKTKNSYVNLTIDEYEEDIIFMIKDYSNHYCVLNYEYQEYLKEKKRQKNKK